MFFKGFIVTVFVSILSVFSLSCAFAGTNGVVDFLPIGAKAMMNAGLKPPKPFFISPMYLYMDENLVISNAKGVVPSLDPNMKVSVDMKDASMITSSYGVRAGFWLFPFMQIFGMYAHSDGYTQFEAQSSVIPGVLPHGYHMNQKIKFTADTGIVGLNALYGFKLGPVFPFGAINVNGAWTDASMLNHVISSIVASARIGAKVPTPVPDVAVSFWVGVMYKQSLIGGRVAGKYDVTLSESDLGPGFEGLAGHPLETDYTAIQHPLSPWNMTAGVAVSLCRYFDIMTEFGFIDKFTANLGVGFNF